MKSSEFAAIEAQAKRAEVDLAMEAQSQRLMAQDSALNSLITLLTILVEDHGLTKSCLFTTDENRREWQKESWPEGVPSMGALHWDLDRLPTLWLRRQLELEMMPGRCFNKNIEDKKIWFVSWWMEAKPFYAVLQFKQDLSPPSQSLLRWGLYSLDWFERLRRSELLAYKDDLTGLYNTRYLKQALESEIRRCQRFATTFTVLFIDLDHLKPVNDKYGHLAGSQLIKLVAEKIKWELREVDWVFRFGGDEFVAMLLETTAEEGVTIAERMRQRIAMTPFEVVKGTSIHITASMGLAAYPQHAQGADELLRLADDSMYLSKKYGKNQVTVFQSQPFDRAKDRGLEEQ